MSASTSAKNGYLLFIRNAAQVVQVCVLGPNAGVLVGLDGCIAAVGPTEELDQLCASQCATVQTTLDATGKCVVPGFCDGHTHPCWSGDRVHEFAMKIAGATYMDIHKAGGGIGFTVRHTRESSEEELASLLSARYDRMLSLGTTLVEAKSGYGLELETETKMLRVLNEVSKLHRVDSVITYLGAHSIPSGSSAQEATRDIVDRQIPALKAMRDSGELRIDFLDVFHEKGVFETPETQEILEAAVAAGFAINFHGDELHPMDSAVLAARLGATTVSHCEEISDEGIAAMAEKNVFAVLLPSTAFLLRLKPPPARAMIDRGVPVALGSDFNPNAHCMSMPRIMNMASVMMRMTMEESLVAATINSAASMNRSDKHGSIEVGKYGDFVIVNAPHWHHLIYQFEPPIETIVKKGHIVAAL